MPPIPALLLAASLLLAPPAAPAQEPPPAPAPAEAAREPGPYIRAAEDGRGVVHLELAARVLEPPGGKGPRIHLVAAVHVGEAAYYAALQERLDALDVVLFEGVRPSGAAPLDPGATEEERAAATRRRLGLLVALAERAHARDGAFPEDPAALARSFWKGGTNAVEGILVDGWGRKVRYARTAPGEGPATARFSSDGPDGRPGTAGEPGDDLDAEAVAGRGDPEGRGPGLQSRLAAALGVAFQGDAIDSSGPRWRSSDMDLDELQRRMEAAGVDPRAFLGLLDGTSAMGRMAGRLLDGMGKDPKTAAWLRLVVVDAAAASGRGLPGGRGGPGIGPSPEEFAALMRVVLEDRNAVVLRDLGDLLRKEPDLADVGVFYGAAHMEDIERRLRAERGYGPGGTTWIRAMSADPRDAGFTPEQARTLRAAMRRMMEAGAGGK